jgi:heat shock protein HslJ
MTFRHGLRSGAVALLVLGAVAACGDDDETTADAPVELDGRSFVATELEGLEIAEGSEVRISFTDGSMAVAAGCNTQTAGYEVTDGTLVLTGELASTMMACDEPLEAQDTFMADLVTSEPTVELDGDQLVLAGADTSATFTEQAS